MKSLVALAHPIVRPGDIDIDIYTVDINGKNAKRCSDLLAGTILETIFDRFPIQTKDLEVKIFGIRIENSATDKIHLTTYL